MPHQNAVIDIGGHVAFEDFSLQQGYAEIVGIAPDSVKKQSHNFQSFFAQGMSAEEVAKRTMYPLEAVIQYAS